MRRYLSSIPCIVLLFLTFPILASAQNDVVLHRFRLGTDGGGPLSSLVADSQGNVYGTTVYGGSPECLDGTIPLGCGTVFRVTRAPGGGWNENVLYAFHGSDGAFPIAGLVLDQAGNLYGTTSDGGGPGPCPNDDGMYGCGTVFELSPPSQPGGAWAEKILYAFTGLSDESRPYGPVVFDGRGNIYGTDAGGYGQCGVVFELSPPVNGQNWAFSVLYSFGSRNDGCSTASALLIDGSGNLYGTNGLGGLTNCSGGGCGTVFELKPPGSTGGSWTENVLYEFQGGADGYIPGPNLIAFRGTLVGVTELGGQYGNGTVFQLTPATSGVTKNTAYSFRGGSDGIEPDEMIVDSGFNFYGTTFSGGGGGNIDTCSGNIGCGTVFKLVPPQSQGGTWTESVLYAFQGGADGALPDGGPILADGWLAGTTSEGGGARACTDTEFHGCGTVFAVHK
jgi:hypothetical protein